MAGQQFSSAGEPARGERCWARTLAVVTGEEAPHELLPQARIAVAQPGSWLPSRRADGGCPFQLKALLEPFGLTRYYTDHWGACSRHLAPMCIARANETPGKSSASI